MSAIELEIIARRAVEAAQSAVRDQFADGVDLAIVVNIAWRTPDGQERAIGSAMPENAPDLLADSLRASTDEAEQVGVVRVGSERYAEGTKEPCICIWCGSPVNRVYHGPNANHTLEAILLPLSGDSPLSDEEKRVYEEARKSVVEARGAGGKDQ